MEYYPDTSSWWTCCQCFREIYPNGDADSCPDCNHYHCDNCGGSDPPRTPIRDTNARTETTFASLQKIFHLRSRPQCLPIYVDRYLVDACADSGSPINCIRADYAGYLGAIIQPVVRQFKLPIQGHFIHSIGVTTLKCSFPAQRSSKLPTEFLVFPRLACKVIFGNGFLTSTKTLSKHRYRLKDVEAAHTTPVIRSVGSTGLTTVECWLDEIPIHSLPDTGADLNLISANLAASIAARRVNQSTEINDSEVTTIEFADCSTVTTRGTIRLTISFHEPTKCLNSTHELVTTALAASSHPERGQVPRNSRIMETFHIVEGLEQQVILCETLLATIDAFNQHRRNFALPTARDTFKCIAVGKEKKGKERKSKVQIGPLEDTAARLADDYNIASDIYQKAIDGVDEQLLYGQIGQEQGFALKDQAKQVFFTWARENKPRFDHFWPGFYEQRFR